VRTLARIPLARSGAIMRCDVHLQTACSPTHSASLINPNDAPAFLAPLSTTFPSSPSYTLNTQNLKTDGSSPRVQGQSPLDNMYPRRILTTQLSVYSDGRRTTTHHRWTLTLPAQPMPWPRAAAGPPTSQAQAASSTPASPRLLRLGLRFQVPALLPAIPARARAGLHRRVRSPPSCSSMGSSMVYRKTSEDTCIRVRGVAFTDG